MVFEHDISRQHTLSSEMKCKVYVCKITTWHNGIVMQNDTIEQWGLQAYSRTSLRSPRPTSECMQGLAQCLRLGENYSFAFVR